MFSQRNRLITALKQGGLIFLSIGIVLILTSAISLETPTVYANGGFRFLTLPFAPHQDMKVVQGWCYDFRSKPPCDHQGIDYIKKPGTSLYPATQWQRFPVVAAADGYACGNCTTGNPSLYGNAVYIVHKINGQTFTTYYGHLSSFASRIPLGNPRKTIFVRRGEVIGTAGDSGSPGLTHLHFMVKQGNTKKDPYDLYTTKEVYPNPPGTNRRLSRANHLWTTNPPSYSR